MVLSGALDGNGQECGTLLIAFPKPRVSGRMIHEDARAERIPRRGGEAAYRDDYDKAFGVKPSDPSRPIPVQPVPSTKRPEQVAYGKLTHEDILRARLEGKIDTATMESMLTHLDSELSPQPVPKSREPMSYYG